MKSCELKRKKPMKRSRRWLSKTNKRRRGYVRDWDGMATETWTKAGGRCERCNFAIPKGVAPAHLIPRDINHPEYDEPWNLAAMGINPCHSHFDLHRGEIAYKALILKDLQESWLLRRCEQDKRLMKYFTRKAESWWYKVGVMECLE